MRERHLTKDELRAEIRDNLAALKSLEKRAVRYNGLKREERRFFWLLFLDLAAVLLPEAGLAGRVAYRLLERADRRLNAPRASQRPVLRSSGAAAAEGGSAAPQSSKGD